MKILVKFPSRERPRQFINTLKDYIKLSSFPENITYMITLDEDDPYVDMYLTEINSIQTKSSFIATIGISKSKIEAVNRDMNNAPDFDILVLASDDMICQVHGWDNILIKEMEDNFPDTDGVLFHLDGYTHLNTMCILGKKYFERFGYIYHPEYKSLWCDNEFMEVADRLVKQYRSNLVLFKHEHFSTNPKVQMDNLMLRTQKFYYHDQRVYNQHKLNNFGLKN